MNLKKCKKCGRSLRTIRRTVRGLFYDHFYCETCDYTFYPGTKYITVKTVKDQEKIELLRQEGWRIFSDVHGGRFRQVRLVSPEHLIPMGD